MNMDMLNDEEKKLLQFYQRAERWSHRLLLPAIFVFFSLGNAAIGIMHWLMSTPRLEICGVSEGMYFQENAEDLFRILPGVDLVPIVWIVLSVLCLICAAFIIKMNRTKRRTLQLIKKLANASANDEATQM